MMTPPYPDTGGRPGTPTPEEVADAIMLDAFTDCWGGRVDRLVLTNDTNNGPVSRGGYSRIAFRALLMRHLSADRARHTRQGVSE